MSTHWLDCPFLTATQVRMVKRSIARPSRVLLLPLKETKTHPPRWRRRIATSRPNLFFGFAKLQSVHICPWLAGLSLPKRRDRRHHGGWNAAATPLGRRKPKHTMWRPDQSTTASGWGSFFIDSAKYLARRRWRCSETSATKVTVARVLSGCERIADPSSSGGLEKVDMAFWRQLGSRHLMYIARPFSSSIALWRICTFSISLPKRMPISEATRCRFRRSSRSRGRKIKGKGHCRLLSIALKAIGSVDQAKA